MSRFSNEAYERAFPRKKDEPEYVEDSAIKEDSDGGDDKPDGESKVTEELVEDNQDS